MRRAAGKVKLDLQTLAAAGGRCPVFAGKSRHHERLHHRKRFDPSMETNLFTVKRIVVLTLLLIGLGSRGMASADSLDPAVNSIYQYFLPSPDAKPGQNLGAYLWIPPNTPKIRAVMIGYHNGLPINILQNATVRAVCRKHGIAQILLTPWAKDIGSIMAGFYDVTDPAKTAVYDHYLQGLADLSGHPELVNAPIVPLAHSAYCEFPFDAAMRKPEQCLAAIPIKAGMPDVYSNFVAGKAKAPKPDMALRYVPILFVSSGSQETVSWSAYPHEFSAAGLGPYRRDRDDNPGTAYEPHDELFGNCWDMTSGHFDMLPRDYQFVADWLDAVATARLPETPEAPMKNLTLKDGSLIDGQIPPTGDLPKDYPMPAPYLQYKGHRDRALWFPNEDLAKRAFDLGYAEPRKKMELFTFLDGSDQPISLAEGSMATYPDPQKMLHGEGLFSLTTYHFLKPPDIDTVNRRKNPTAPPVYANVLFPGKTSLPTTNIPLQFDSHGGDLVLVKSEQFKDDRGVTETRFTLRLVRHRIDSDAGFVMSFVRVFHQSTQEFAAAGRTCVIKWTPANADRNAKPQTLDFPPVPDALATTAEIPLNAKSSSGLPVDYFVLKGPGIIKDGAFIPNEVPAGTIAPIEVTVGAYQVGLFDAGHGIKPSETIYQTFHLKPQAMR
jgi:hypothetical protein